VRPISGLKDSLKNPEFPVVQVPSLQVVPKSNPDLFRSWRPDYHHVSHLPLSSGRLLCLSILGLLSLPEAGPVRAKRTKRELEPERKRPLSFSAYKGFSRGRAEYAKAIEARFQLLPGYHTKPRRIDNLWPKYTYAVMFRLQPSTGQTPGSTLPLLTEHGFPEGRGHN